MLNITENVQITMNIPFDIIEEARGKGLMLLKSYDYIYDLKGGAQFRIDNLFNGDKNLSLNIVDHNYYFFSFTLYPTNIRLERRNLGT